MVVVVAREKEEEDGDEAQLALMKEINSSSKEALSVLLINRVTSSIECER